MRLGYLLLCPLYTFVDQLPQKVVDRAVIWLDLVSQEYASSVKIVFRASNLVGTHS